MVRARFYVRIKKCYFKFECKSYLTTMKQNLFLDFKNVEIKQRNKIILNSVNLKIMKGEFVYFVVE